jgi:AcrR family transcriptional regulator
LRASQQDAPLPAALRNASRRERKKVRTRGEIFRAAMGLFSARGFDAVTVEQICAAADVAKATFFLHYSSKSALLTEWNRELAAELAETLHEPRGSSLSEYRMLAEHLGEQWLRRPDATRALLRELIAPPAPGGDTAQAGADRDLRAIVEAVVRRGQQRGELRRNVPARLAALAFLATCAAAFAGYREGEVAPEQVRNDLLHALLHGLLEPKPRLKWRPS